MDRYSIKQEFAQGDNSKERAFDAMIRRARREALESIARDVEDEDLRRTTWDVSPEVKRSRREDARFIRHQARVKYPTASWESD